MRRIIVVGASLAGYRAVQTLRRDGFEGTITIVGAEPSRPYDRPPLSKRFLSGEAGLADISLERGGEDLDVEWRLGVAATSFDSATLTVTLDGGEPLVADGVILACGARPRPLPGDPVEGVHVLRTANDSAALRSDLQAGPGRLLVIGAGFIGAEVAATARGMGVEVTIVEALDLPMARALPPVLGQVCADLHRDHGVELRLGVGVDGLDADGRGRVSGVRLADGTAVEADVVLAGIGVVPNTEWLEGSGLTIDDGVVCDTTTLAAPGVVAAGDVARWTNARFGESMRIEHWDNAVAMGQHAARRLLAGEGPGEPYDPVPYFWSDQYDRKLQLAGRVAAGDTVEVIEGSIDERRFVALIGRDDRLIGVFAMNRPPAIPRWSQRIADGIAWHEALQLVE